MNKKKQLLITLFLLGVVGCSDTDSLRNKKAAERCEAWGGISLYSIWDNNFKDCLTESRKGDRQ